MDVQPKQARDREEVRSFLAEHGSDRVARRGEVVDPLAHLALIARTDDQLVGVATYVVDHQGCELLTLHARQSGAGVGSVLLDGVARAARAAGCERLWVVTTNDNVNALRFYQRHGFRLTHLRPGAVDEVRRRLKPEIPEVGAHGIPLRDELELEMRL